jgi:hypothetical protein
MLGEREWLYTDGYIANIIFKSMNEKGDNRTKKEEEEPYLKSCEKCTKFFTNQQAYETHLRIKHEDQERKEPSEEEASDEESEEDDDRENNSKKANKNIPIRSRMLEMQRNELEDNIYTFLGELGEKNVEPISSRAEIINFANDQKLTGQTNYSVNKVIRTPYEEPIKCSEEIPVGDIEKSKCREFLEKLRGELTVLEGRIEEEKEKW